MAAARSLYVKVAGGQCRGGYWALYWPAWKWARLAADEQAAVIARQRALMESKRQTAACINNGRQMAGPTVKGAKHD